MFKLNSLMRLVVTASLVLSFTSLTHTACAQESDRIDLSGQWKFFTERGYKRGDRGNSDKGFHLPQFNDSKWRDLAIGTKWESQGVSYDGIAWYRKQFTVPSSWKGRTLILQLGDPDDGAEVYLNGKSLGTWKFTEDIFCVLPDDALAYGQTNTLAIRVWDWYKSGGVGGTDFNLQCFSSIKPTQPSGPESMQLSFMDDLPDNPIDSKHWENGWRDGGTSDTRPRFSVDRKACDGQDAIVFDVWYPNSAEFADAILDVNQRGSVWQAYDYDHISFKYQVQSMAGHVTVQLNTGKRKWGARGVQIWQAQIPVSPTSPGQWQQVTIPFTYFTRHVRESTFDTVHNLISTDQIVRVVLGYQNHALDNPGIIKFADFKVGRSSDSAPFLKPITLRGLWRYMADNKRPDGSKSELDTKVARDNPDQLTDDQKGYGQQLGYHKTEFDDASWDLIQVGNKWIGKGSGLLGPSWFRQKILVPAQWEGRDLTLNLGKPRDRAKLYWNGQLLGQTTENEAALSVTIPADKVHFGKDNQLAVQVTTWRNRVGFYNGAVNLAVTDHAVLLVTDSDDLTRAVKPADFDMGVQTPKQLQLLMRWAGTASPGQKLTAHYSIRDCFKRNVIDGQAALTRDRHGNWQALIKLDNKQSVQLYYAEWFRARVHVTDKNGKVLTAQSFPDDSEKHLKFKYAKRDQLSLPQLDNKVENTPYGDLKLVDVINCATDPDVDPHPYKEGGIRNAWVKVRAYAAWEHGVSVKTFKDRQYREANNNEFFAYRIGRGKLKPHKGYVLRVLVPDNDVRYQVMEIKTGRNYQGTGFRSGVRPDYSTDNFPQSNEYQWYDHIVFNDEMTYGYEGARATGSENGFWVVFHDNGRCYSAEYNVGPAAAEIRLYELPDDDSALPTIRYPENLPRRVLMMDWERQPEAPPADVVSYARHMGMNAIGPVMQKWLSHAFFESKTGMRPPGWYRAAPEGQRDEDVYGWWLDATRKANLPIIPRIEYGGGPNLPKEAHVIAPNGKIDPCGRFVRWGANILHPATWEELKTMIDELIGQNIKANPQIAGLLWRQRSDRIKISFGPDDVYLFCKETGRDMPTGNDKQIAQWAAKTMNEPYTQWWQGKRADFLRKVRDLLKSYRSDLVLYYYNWDADGWKPGVKANNINKPQDWSDYYNVANAAAYKERFEQIRKNYDQQFFIDHVSKSKQAHYNIYPDMFAKDKDIVIFAPVHWQYLANNGPYINYFKTGDGLAICDMFYYEEKGRWNLQNDRYETSELTPGGKDFGMAYMVEAFYHGDPNIITTTTYTYGRGWADVHRRFAQAFLALPDQRGEIVENAVSKELTDHVRA
ncbi:MAG TPA: hypothetical protein DCM28_14175, partial [Phycisphaerales bacterium]|nr:hypothetical protein [Phycisphaerales bacterium]